MDRRTAPPHPLVPAPLPLLGLCVLEQGGLRTRLCGRLLAALGATVRRLPEGANRFAAAGEADEFGWPIPLEVFLDAGKETRTEAGNLAQGAASGVEVLLSASPPSCGSSPRGDRGYARLLLNPDWFAEPQVFSSLPAKGSEVSHLAGDATGQQQLRAIDWRNGLAAAARSVIALLTALLAPPGSYPQADHDLRSLATTDRSLFASAPWRERNALFAHLATSDGTVSASLLGDWTSLAAWAVSEGAAADLADPQWQSLSARRRAAATLFAQLECWTRTRTAHELTERAQLLRLPWATLRPVSAVARDPHLRARHFFLPTGTSHGTPWCIPRSPLRFWQLADRLRSQANVSPACFAGAGVPGPLPKHERKHGGAPLAGVRVVDFTWAVAGPLATRILASLGAHVLHVVHPRAREVEFDEPVAAWLAQGKETLALDLSTANGRALAREAIEAADVVIDNFSPRVMEQWQLGPAELLARLPRLVVVRMPAFGLEGPYRNWVGFGPTVEAWSGYAQTFGSSEFEHLPALAGGADSDLLHGLFAALGTLAGLVARNASGSGKLVEAAQFEGTSFALGPLLTRPIELHSPVFSGIPLETERNVPCPESSKPS